MAGCTAMVAPLARRRRRLQLPGDGSGQLTPEDRQAIKEATGVSAAVRYRDSWGMRMLTLAGPPDNLSEARRMATARLVASQQARPTEAEKLADLTERLGAVAHRPAAPSLLLRHGAACSCPACAPPRPPPPQKQRQQPKGSAQKAGKLVTVAKPRPRRLQHKPCR